MFIFHIQEQYQFIFDALVEYFVIGNTSIQVDDFRSDLGRLNEINIGSGKSYLEEQYEVCVINHEQVIVNKCTDPSYMHAVFKCTKLHGQTIL